MHQQKANLDAWYVLQTVVDQGGFAQAAQQLRRSQSAVSYSISKLEEQLQLELLTIQGRRAVLTTAGQSLLAQARQLLTEYQRLVTHAEHLHQGHASEIRLWVDGLYPMQRLQKALLAFRQQSPQTRLYIQHGLIDANLSEFDIVISPQQLSGKSQHELGEVELLAVAHANHPLFDLEAPIERSSLRSFIQVGLDSELLAEQEQHWIVTTFAQAKEYITLGLAYGWLPAEMVDEEIKIGSLKPLPLAHGQRYQVRVYLQLMNQNPSSVDINNLARLIYQPS